MTGICSSYLRENNNINSNCTNHANRASPHYFIVRYIKLASSGGTPTDVNFLIASVCALFSVMDEDALA